MKEPLINKGWVRALIFLFVWLMLQMGLIQLLAKLLLPLAGVEGENADPGLRMLLMSSIGIVIYLPVTFVFRKIVDRKSIVSLGFQWKGYQEHAASGFLASLFVMALGTLVLMLTGILHYFDLQITIKSIAISVTVMTLIAFSEEVVVRGYILNNLLDSFPKWIALLISATLFALLHVMNPGISWLSMLGVFAGGIILGLNYIYTRNLWFGIFLHFGWNFFQGPVLGYEVSGLETDKILTPSLNGPDWLTGCKFGFEGSVLAPVLVAIVVLFLYSRYNKTVKM